MVCAVEVLESIPFCESPVISGVIRDVLVWADWVLQSTPNALHVLRMVVMGVVVRRALEWRVVLLKW